MLARAFGHYREHPDLQLRDSPGSYVISVPRAAGILRAMRLGRVGHGAQGKLYCGKIAHEVDHDSGEALECNLEGLDPKRLSMKFFDGRKLR